MKKFLACIAVALVSATALFSGCLITSGADGKDGKNASAYDYYELAKTVPGQENMTVDEFLHKYLNYTPDELKEAFSLQSSMNRSLMSAVAVAAQFTVGMRTSTALGSGVIVELDKEKGNAYVLTNCHVIYNDISTEVYSKSVYLYLYGQDADYNDEENRIKAEVIGASITYDIALLQVTDSALLKSDNCHAVAAEFTTEDDIYIGEDVYTVGNAEGYGFSVTRGIVSKDREIITLNISDRYASSDSHTRDYTVIRTDAAVNEGNSGGALFNRDGKIVAIINSKAGDGVDAMGYGIPASVVRRLYPLMKESYEENGFQKTLNRAHFIVAEDFTKAEKDKSTAIMESKLEIGVEYQPAFWNSEEDRAEIRESVVVNKVIYGLKIGDLVKHITVKNGDTVIEDRDVSRLYHLQDTLLSVREGYTVTLKVARGNDELDVTLTGMSLSSFD